EVRHRACEPDRREQNRHHRGKPADEAEPDNELSGRERPKRVACVPAAVEVGHAACPLATARVGGELGALRMERRDSEAPRPKAPPSRARRFPPSCRRHSPMLSGRSAQPAKATRPSPCPGPHTRRSAWKRDGNDRVQPGENTGLPNLPKTARSSRFAG